MDYPNYLNAFQRPYNGLTQVSGIEGAKAYQMPPNSAVALFHNDEDMFFVKTTDGAGFPSIRAFRFEEVEAEPVRDTGLRKEVDAIREELGDVKQSIQAIAAAIPSAAAQAACTGEPAGAVQPPDEHEPAV
mgnify:FL=1